MKSSWQTKKFKDVVINIPLTHRKVKRRDYIIAGKYPVIDQGQDLIGGYTNDESKVITNKGGAVVFGDHTKAVKYLTTDFAPGADGIKVLLPRNDFTPKALYYFTRAIQLPNKGYARHYQYLEDSSINVPPIDEQNIIAQTLDSLFSKIDAGKEDLKQVEKLLEVYRQAVLKKAFEAKNAVKFKVHELFELIDGDRGNKYPKKTDYIKNQGFCLFLSTKNVRPYGFVFDEVLFITKEKHRELRAGLLEKGDLVITTRGTLGNIALFDESIPYENIRINSGMLILRQKKDVAVNPKFFAFFVQSALFESQLNSKRSGTAQPQIPAGVLREFDIAVPDLDSQNKIVATIEQEISFVNVLRDIIQDSTTLSNSLRQSILKMAFNGELT